jgi:Ni/Co efflux regulator RcnB
MERIMKRNAIVSALMAMSLVMAGPVFAQGDGDQQARERGMRQMQRISQQEGERGHEQRGQRGDEQHARGGDRHHGERGAGPDHRFYRGDRLPMEYRGRSYVVNDWRGHRLSAPPRGYRWVQAGGDYVLVAIGSGVILQLQLN